MECVTPGNTPLSSDSIGTPRKVRARRGFRRPLTLVQRQNLARYLVYFTLPVLSLAAMGFALDGSRRAVTFLALLALLPGLLLFSRSRLEPVGPWVVRRTRRREIALLERLWASSPTSQS
jgi:hypothetical protein